MENIIENSLDGYKFLVTMVIYTDDMLQISGEDNICICDTRDECIGEIKKHLEHTKEGNNKEGVVCTPYLVDRCGTYVKWTDMKEDKSWIWEYSIIPVKYIENNNQ